MRKGNSDMNFDGYYKGKQVLITGGMGFLGSNLAHRLLGLGADVTLLDCFLAGHGANPRNIAGIEDSVEVIRRDIRDEAAVARAVDGCDVVFHIAAQTSHTDSMKDPWLDIDVNCTGNMVFLEAVRKTNPAAKVVYVSTRAVYGAPLQSPATEMTPPNPTDIYGANKFTGEAYHLIYHRAHGIPVTVIRASNAYGPRAQIEKPVFGILNWFIGLALQNKTIRVFGDGAQLRDYTYVDDMLEAFLLAGSRPEAIGRVYNAGAREQVRFVDMVKMIVEVAGQGGHEFVPWPDDYKKIEVGDFVADNSRIEKELGWAPRTGLREGLEKTVAFYRENLKYYLKDE